MVAAIASVFWGYNTPGCIVWAIVHRNGRLVCVADAKFHRSPVEDVVSMFRERTSRMNLAKIPFIYGNVEMLSKRREGVIEAESPAEAFTRFGLPVAAAGANVTHGWQRIHDFLRLAPDGRPWLQFTADCKSLIRTLPSIVQRQNDHDDCDGDLYAAHALRVLVSARPLPANARDTRRKKYERGTVGWLRSLGEDKTSGVLVTRKAVLA